MLFSIGKKDDAIELYVEGQLAGRATISENGEIGVTLDSIEVDKKYRKEGLGTVLVDAVVRECKRRQKEMLLVKLTNPELYSFYKRMGFVRGLDYIYKCL